jgi:nitrogen-specific signal transduction histidine kinase
MKGCTTDQEADRLVDLLRSMLVLDPDKRPSARHLLEVHTWLGEVQVTANLN